MFRISNRLTMMSALAVIMVVTAHAATAQERVRLAFLDRIFGDSERVSPPTPQASPSNPQGQTGQPPAPTAVQGPPPAPSVVAPGSEADLVMRIGRLENQIRQLTGVIEQLQFRNQQLEGKLKQALGGSSPPATTATTQVPGVLAQPPAIAQPAPAQPPGPPAPRGDAFDPAQNPGAPGSPRVMGTIPSGNAPPAAELDHDETIGAPGGRQAGAPLDLSTLAVPGGRPPSAGMQPGQPLPPPQQRTPGGAGAQVATLPPSDNPRDHFDLAYGYILRKDYALAENTFRGFLEKHPGDRLAPDALYWLGESMFQRQRFRDAAETFLNVSTKHETAAKAPESLLRLGQSLAALGEKEAACASFAEVLRKYPRASVGVRQGVGREQKRAGC
jgi:tol-pal system protein YbgF